MNQQELSQSAPLQFTPGITIPALPYSHNFHQIVMKLILASILV